MSSINFKLTVYRGRLLMESKIWDILYQSKLNMGTERKSVVSYRLNERGNVSLDEGYDPLFLVWFIYINLYMSEF